MHGSHVGGEEERTIVIPLMSFFLAMSIMVYKLQCLRRWCQVLSVGTHFAYMAELEGVGTLSGGREGAEVTNAEDEEVAIDLQSETGGLVWVTLAVEQFRM